MNRKNVRLIFLREVRDQIRDRRTLFMIVVLPLILYPGLAIGMLEISLLIKEQPRTVVLLGADNLPAQPPLVRDNHFDPRWFALPDEGDKLTVVYEGPHSSKPEKGEAARPEKADPESNDRLLKEGRELTALAQRLEDLQKEQEGPRTNSQSSTDEGLARQILSARENLADRFNASKIQVLIVVPRGLKEEIDRTNLALKTRANTKAGPTAAPDKLRLLVIQNSADEKSSFTYQRVRLVLSAWEQQILQERLSQAQLPPTLAKPVDPRLLDLAVARQVSATLWSKLFPTLLIIMAVTGAFYPAVDLAAGEKERGTMETLLICPARRSEIVLGKFFTVMTFSLSTVLLNLFSMGFTGKYLLSAARNEAMNRMGAGALSFPGPWELMWLVLLLIPLAAFFSAVSLALATFARSTKEGQYYLTPLLLVTLGLTMFCLSPVVEIEPFYSILPVVGPALLLKEVLASPGSSAPLIYGIPVLATSIAYSLIGLWWAITMFNREDVLFREAERFELQLWIRHLLRDKPSTPTSAEALLCFVLILLLQFVAVRFLQGGVVLVDGRLDAASSLRLLLIQQFLFVGAPALLLGILLTTSLVKTFRLRLPDSKYLIAGCLLPIVLHPLTGALAAWLQTWFFPPLPKPIIELMNGLRDPSLPLWFVLTAMAVAPGICEELAFRGFILSGLTRSARPAVAIVLSSMAFGIIHIIPQQVFNAALLGLVLGLLAIRSRSLLPGVVFHITYNSLELLRERLGTSLIEAPVVKWFVTTAPSDSQPAVVEYNALAYVVAGGVAAALIGWLAFGGRKQPSAGATDDLFGNSDSQSDRRSSEAIVNGQRRN